MPGRDCDTCKHWRPSQISERLKWVYAKCASPRRESTEILHAGDHFVMPVFAETCRGIPELCGPSAKWWETRPQQFELVEDEPSQLDWDEEDDESRTPD